MNKYEYDFVKSEIEREKQAPEGGFYLFGRMLPYNWNQLKAEYLRNEGIYIEPLENTTKNSH
jgi:hypothetical protein